MPVKVLRSRFALWAVLLLLSIAVQYAVPMIGDEAYFVSWGGTPAAGYYDHPPLTGWISAVIWQVESLLGISPHGILHRISMLLASIATLFWLRGYFSARYPDLRFGSLAMGFAALPASLIMFNVFMNDTLLTFYILGFLIATERAFSSVEMRWSPVVAAGVFFGMALGTKYSAGIFFLGLVLYLLTNAAGRRFLFGRFIVISAIAGIPFVLNLIWNYYNCSVNLAFNFAFRDIEAGLIGLAFFAGTLVFILGPTVFFIAKNLTVRPGFFGGVLLGNIVVIAVYSISRGYFGLNWGVPLLAIALLAVPEMLKPVDIARMAKWNLVYGAVFMLPFLALFGSVQSRLLALDSIVSVEEAYPVNLDLDLADGSLVAALRPYSDGRVVAAASYGLRANLENHGIEATTVFNTAVFGRNQDVFTDFRALDGRDMLYIPYTRSDGLTQAEELFETVEILTLQGNRQEHTVYLGRGFDYAAFRVEMILPVLAKFYDKSPFPAGRCFMDKYRAFDGK